MQAYITDIENMAEINIEGHTLLVYYKTTYCDQGLGWVEGYGTHIDIVLDDLEIEEIYWLVENKEKIKKAWDHYRQRLRVEGKHFFPSTIATHDKIKVQLRQQNIDRIAEAIMEALNE